MHIFTSKNNLYKPNNLLALKNVAIFSTQLGKIEIVLLASNPTPALWQERLWIRHFNLLGGDTFKIQKAFHLKGFLLF
jgi:hypothetical protein